MRSDLESAGRQSPSIDLRVLRCLSDRTPGGLAKQVERFFDALTKVETRAQLAAKEGNSRALGDAAHSALSMGRMISHEGVIAAAQELEAATTTGNPAEIAHCNCRMHKEIGRLKTAISPVPICAGSRMKPRSWA